MANKPAVPKVQVSDRANQRNALAAGFLGWTLDAFDFFVLTFVLVPVARDFGVSLVQIAATITASLAPGARGKTTGLESMTVSPTIHSILSEPRGKCCPS